MISRRSILALALWPLPALAAETSGGPVNTVLTLGGEPMMVNVSWLQSGGVVILKIASLHPIAADLQKPKLAAADVLLKGRPGYRASFNGNGHLIITFRITGWNKPFTERDMGIGPAP